MNTIIYREREIWRAVQRGDMKAFDELYQLYIQVVYSAVYKHIGHRQDAEDLTQEVFLDLWKRRGQITIQTSLFNYIYSIARYKTLRYIRDKGIHPRSLDLLIMEDEGYSPLPERDIRRAAAKVAMEVASLPLQMKKVFELSEENNFSVAEIAEELQISPNTVRNHLAKARTRLRNIVSRLAVLLFF
ncbi:RNA polymerase sigma factor [Flavitalea flava]